MGTAVDYCQWETVNVSCTGDDVIIVVTSARYGRMRVGRCVPVDYFTGCAVDVLPALERRCSGWKHCSVAVSDRQLFRVQPCRKDLVAYLELAYRCISGMGSDTLPVNQYSRGAASGPESGDITANKDKTINNNL